MRVLMEFSIVSFLLFDALLFVVLVVLWWVAGETLVERKNISEVLCPSIVWEEKQNGQCHSRVPRRSKKRALTSRNGATRGCSAMA